MQDFDNVYEEKGLVTEKSLMMTGKIVVQYIISDIQKKPRSFKIGLFSIYLVVMFLSLVQSAFQLSTIIFLELAETSAGDTDILLAPIAGINDTTPDDTIVFGPVDETSQSGLLQDLNSYGDILGGIRLINTTQVEQTIQRMSSVYGQSPRWLITGDLLNPKPNAVQITDKMRTFVLVIDSLHEMSIGLGRRFDENSIASISFSITKDDEAFVTSSALRGLNLTEGDKIDLNINLVDFIFSQRPNLVDKVNANEDDYLTEQVKELMKTSIVEPLRQQFGSSVIDAEINTDDLKTLVDTANNYVQDVEDDEAYRKVLKDYLDQQINDADLGSPEQNDNLRNVVDYLFEQNLTNTTRDIKEVVDDLPRNTTFTIAEVILDLAPYVVEALNLTLHLRVKYSIDSPHGKWTSGLGNVIAMDYRNLTPFIVESFRTNLETILDREPDGTARLGRLLLIDPVVDPLQTASFDLNLSDYSLSSNFALNDRINMYSSTQSIRDRVIDVSNDFYTKIGKSHPSQIQTPLADQAQGYLILQNFLDNLVVSATFLLLMLSMLLIYSLMIGDVEEKTYEFGMLRALGFNKTWLVVLLFLEALIFAIPGLAIGLISSYLFNSLIANLIFGSSQMISSYQLHYSAVALGVSIGLFVPLLSNILPIMRALSKTLRDSLDLYHRTIDEITVSVVKLEKLGLSIDQTMTALLLVVMGFVCYYLAPQAFIFQNIKLFLAIINIVLIIMIVGFTLIANLLQSPFENALINLMLCIYKPDRNLKQIIVKNMQGHYRRNSKTTLMYTLALSFLIFAGTGFTLQTVVIEDILRSYIGANMAVFTLDDYGLDESKIRTFMEKQMQLDPTLVRAYSFSSFTMNSMEGISRAKISPLSSFPQRNVQLIGVEENLLHSIDQRYYMPNEYDQGISYPLLENGKKDGVSGLYNRDGNVDLPANSDIYRIQSNSQIRKTFSDKISRNNFQDVGIDREINLVLPEGYKYEVSMDVSTPAMITVQNHVFRVKVRHMATKIPGFVFSGYRMVTAQGNGLISMEDFNYMINKVYSLDSNDEGAVNLEQVNFFFDQLPRNLSYNIPKDSLYIMFDRPTTYNERVDFANGLRNYFRDEKTLLFDVITLVADTATTFGYINLFYIVVALIAITLSFFLLLVSFVSNVRENNWEFGVLRAVGLNKKQITRVYVYEALALIIASGLIGTVVGIIVAIAITAQLVIFTELPFTFVFPTAMFLLTFLGGLLTAIFGSYFAVREIRDKSISSILKGLI